MGIAGGNFHLRATTSPYPCSLLVKHLDQCTLVPDIEPFKQNLFLMKKVLTSIFSCLIFALGMSQSAPNFWQDVQHDQVFLPETSETIAVPENHRLLSLDYEGIKNVLSNAPFEGTPEARSSAVELQLPMPDGGMETFRVWEYSCMHPDLAARYPMIRSFSGVGVTNPHHIVKLGFGPQGLHVFVPSENGGSFVTRYATDQTQYYACHNNSDFVLGGLDAPENFVKYVPMKGEKEDGTRNKEDDEITLRSGGGEGALTERRDYRFALACTGEYGATHGGTVQSVLNSMVQATDVLNGVLERDADMRLVLIGSNDQLIFLNAQTDPYVNSNLGIELLEQNETNLNNIIGLSSFDVGHLFTGGCSDVGGVVSGSVCSGGKARGVTCHSNGNVQGITINIAAHEMGHQLTGGHTFNNCPGFPDQFHSGSAWEPGSGSTIVSYYNSCGPQNVSGGKNIHYHNGTMEEYWTYTKLGGGDFCPLVTETSNHSPIVELSYTDGFYIPISTPFELEASATDADGDALTYAWEQMDLGPVSQLGSPNGSAPSFRVYDPANVPYRIFPRIETILNNSNSTREVLPSYDRELNFRCAVRDNNVTEGAGGISWADVSFEATATAGPFRVTSPNTSNITWTAGEQVEVTWDVANTDNALVNCQSVDILLSTDGGHTFDIVVASGTYNDGSETIIVPDVASSTVRLKIKAAKNIFFDLSNSNFEIVPPAEPTYGLISSPGYHQVCVPDVPVTAFTAESIGGFDEPIEITLLGGLPNNVDYQFSSTTVLPGESVTLELDMNNVDEDDLFVVELMAVGGDDTLFQSLIYDVVYSDFSALELTGPTDGISGQGLLGMFEWNGLPQANFYDIQIASHPSFEPDYIIDEAYGLDGTDFISEVALEASTIYYWRIRPSNECTVGDFTPAKTFQTFTTTCNSFASTDVPQNISAVGLPVIESLLTVLESGTISDVNITKLKGNHDTMGDLKVSIISPEGTEVALINGNCGNVSLFDFGVDDESPFDIDCPPLNGLDYKPQEPLSAFDGENTVGNWTLKAEVIDTDGAGGELIAWGIEFCSAVDALHPFLVENDTIYVQPLDTRVIHNFELFADDADTPAENLRFTVVDTTKHGYISKDGVPLAPGETFSLVQINAQKITYTNTNPDVDYDFFTFHITDGEGGLFGTPRFNIVIDENAVTDVDEQAFANEMLLFPNPATTSLTVAFQHALSSDATIAVTDVQGQMLQRRQIDQAAQNISLDLTGYADGIYFLTVRAQEGVFAKKFIVQQ